jgi:hypothetical protein
MLRSPHMLYGFPLSKSQSQPSRAMVWLNSKLGENNVAWLNQAQQTDKNLKQAA